MPKRIVDEDGKHCTKPKMEFNTIRGASVYNDDLPRGELGHGQVITLVDNCEMRYRVGEEADGS